MMKQAAFNIQSVLILIGMGASLLAPQGFHYALVRLICLLIIAIVGCSALKLNSLIGPIVGSLSWWFVVQDHLLS